MRYDADVGIGVGGRWRSSPLAGDDAQLSPQASAAQQGLRYAADPPTIDEIIAVMRGAGDRADGHRLRAAHADRLACKVDITPLERQQLSQTEPVKAAVRASAVSLRAGGAHEPCTG